MEQGNRRKLITILDELDSALVAFSGGVDSTLLLAIAADTLGRDNTLAVTAASPSLPSGDLEDAERLASRIGVHWEVVRTDELSDARYRANTRQRCYYCKHHIFSMLVERARRENLDAVLDGANADDTGDWRPGLRAVHELGIRSPLMQAGLTKRDVRQLSCELGLPTAEKPSAACLASRIPYGTEISEALLRTVDRAEQALRSHGFRELRVRHHGNTARLELGAEELARMKDAAFASRVASDVGAAGFSSVVLDLAGFRSGSMNEAVDGSGPGLAPGSPLLRELGLPDGEFEARGDSAVLNLSDNDRAYLWETGRREHIVKEFRDRGFTHVALELTGEP